MAKDTFAKTLVRNFESSNPITAGYCRRFDILDKLPFNSRSFCYNKGSSRNIAFKFEFLFKDPGHEGQLELEFGSDFGYGAAIYFNGKLDVTY